MNGKLPIYEAEDDILKNLKDKNRLIIQSPTGSGKSTQVPQILYKNNVNRDGAILILQPRRIAARLLALRVSRELGVRLGDIVGYQVRFEDVSSENTRIKYVTEGILLRILLSNPTLDGVKVVIFDEFHERHLYGDISLARILLLQKTKRPDLKIIVMSATLNIANLREYLTPCGEISCNGRLYPVGVEYFDQPKLPMWEAAALAFSKYRRCGDVGDVLVFMPGGYEIRKTIEELERLNESRGYLILPLYGDLPAELQDAAVSQYDKPKIVVATNVAETSITIEGIKAVIDSGFAKIPRYDSHRGINTLYNEKISRASAEQRTGRAGRTAPGICIRLWNEREHQNRPAEQQPEIERLELSEVVLMLKASGVNDLRQFEWFEAPSEISLNSAEKLLEDLGAIDENGIITVIGEKMLKYPIHPRYSRMLIEAEKYGCNYHCALIAALNQGNDILIRSTSNEIIKSRKSVFGKSLNSDFFLMIRAFEYAKNRGYDYSACWSVGINANSARMVDSVFNQFINIAGGKSLNVEPENIDEELIQKCILAGFSDRVARRINEANLKCEIVHSGRGELARSSVVQNSSLIVAAEINEIGNHSGDVNVILSKATAIKEEWLYELYPTEIKKGVQRYYFDQQMRRVMVEEETIFRGLCLNRVHKDAEPSDITDAILAEQILIGNLKLTDWDDSLEQWFMRVNFLAKWCPELKIPEIGEKDKIGVLKRFCGNSISYKGIKDRPVKPLFYELLTYEQHKALEIYAPQRLKLSNGRTPKVIYVSSNMPYISLRIQELYDVMSVPKIAMGRVDVQVHILAPNMRPVQITSDLAGFWDKHYPTLKQQFQRLYPKHQWR